MFLKDKIGVGTIFLLWIDGSNFEIHAVNGCEDIGSTLNDTLSCFRHGNGSTPGKENRLVPGA